MTSRHLGSTYRLQLNGLGFAAATRLVPFLDELGIETCYLSPVTRARAGSTHGYDVVDPNALDPSLGTGAEFDDLLAALEARRMGVLLDIVPNHMAASTESPFFADVLRGGPDSEYAPWFDIAWDEQDGKVLLPVLGDALPSVIARGELAVVRDGDRLALGYFDHRFPLAPGSEAAPELTELLELQHYRLADWRVANRDVNYRRFFDINELIGVRQEDPAVFAATHRLVLELLADPRVRGVRVDHVDGLRDPSGYLSTLRAATAGRDPSPVILVEKILAGDERLPDWPIEGTTGYEVAAAIVGLFVDGYGAAELRTAMASATGDLRTFAERAVDAKRRAIETLLPHQLDRVVDRLRQVMPDAAGADLTIALRDLTAYLAAYRTYRRPGEAANRQDIDLIETAAGWARRHRHGSGAELIGSLVEVLAGSLPPDTPQWQAVGGWQQLSGPAAAKGVEDTAMYDSGTLLAVADVGADPDRPSVLPAAFHELMTRRAADHPGALTSTSTHDSKRSHDLRCRLAVLSEIPDEWEAAVQGLEALSGVDLAAPDAADRRYLYETLVGAWPVDVSADESFVSRIREYVVKSAREAKRHSSWVDPDEGYERALTDLVTRIAAAGDGRAIVEPVVAAIECAAATNSLASVLLKAMVPGVPDVYQGDDAWFLALVDPDNRAPLDAQRHRDLAASLPGEADASLLGDWRSGRVKQFVLRRVLELRRSAPDLFAAGSYGPLAVEGAAADHVVGFARRRGDREAITVVPRLTHTLVGPARFPVGPECWADTAIRVPGASYRELLTGQVIVPADGRIEVAALFATLPLAVLDRTE